jgi:hypothetical protein
MIVMFGERLDELLLSAQTSDYTQNTPALPALNTD